MSATPSTAAQPRSSRAAPLARHAFGTFGFVGAKAMVFLAPLLVLRAVGVRDYGILEYGLAWGTPLAVLFCIGAGGAVPYFLLKRGRPEYRDSVRLSAMVSGVALIPAVALLVSHSISFPTYLAVLITIIFVLQTIYASEFKTFGAPALASLAESGNYVVIVVLAVGAFAVKSPLTLKAIAGVLTVYAAACAAVSFWQFDWRVSPSRHWRRIRKVLGYGYPLIITGLLTAVLTSSGRLLAGHFFTMSDVGTYSLFLRVSSAVILVHQLANTLIFPRVYLAGTDRLDKYFSGLMATIFVVSLMVFFLAPFLLAPFLPLMRGLSGENRRMFFVFGFQMVFWAGTAMLEIIVNRENSARYYVGVLSGCVTLLVAAIFVLHAIDRLTLLRLCQLNMSCIFASFMAQCLLLRGRGVRFRYMPIFSVTVFVLYWVTSPLLA